MPRPMSVNISESWFIWAKVSPVEAAGVNESMTFPIRNTKDGIPKPQMAAQIHPKYISNLSCFDAKL